MVRPAVLELCAAVPHAIKQKVQVSFLPFFSADIEILVNLLNFSIILPALSVLETMGQTLKLMGDSFLDAVATPSTMTCCCALLVVLAKRREL